MSWWRTPLCDVRGRAPFLVLKSLDRLCAWRAASVHEVAPPAVTHGKTSWESELPHVRREASTFTWHDWCMHQSNQSVQSDKLHIYDQWGGGVIQAVTPLKSAVTQHNGLEAASDTRTEKVAPMSERLTSPSVWLSPKIEANCLRKQCILGGMFSKVAAPRQKGGMWCHQAMCPCEEDLCRWAPCAHLTQPAASWPDNVNIITFISCQPDAPKRAGNGGEVRHLVSQSVSRSWSCSNKPSVSVIQQYLDFVPCNPLNLWPVYKGIVHHFGVCTVHL